jgi:hypothetical protein
MFLLVLQILQRNDIHRTTIIYIYIYNIMVVDLGEKLVSTTGTFEQAV